MSEQKLNQIESMLSDLILSVGTLKAYFEEEREENQRRFAEMDKRFEHMETRFEHMETRFEHMETRFDEVLTELRSNKAEHDYLAARLFRAEMEIDNLKTQLARK